MTGVQTCALPISSVVVAGAVVAGAAIAAESIVAGAVVSTVPVSVVVVASVAGFDSHEARATAQNRADTFRRLFIVVVSLKNCLKTPFIQNTPKGNPPSKIIFGRGYPSAFRVLTAKVNGEGHCFLH